MKPFFKNIPRITKSLSKSIQETIKPLFMKEIVITTVLVIAVVILLYLNYAAIVRYDCMIAELEKMNSSLESLHSDLASIKREVAALKNELKELKEECSPPAEEEEEFLPPVEKKNGFGNRLANLYAVRHAKSIFLCWTFAISFFKLGWALFDRFG